MREIPYVGAKSLASIAARTLLARAVLAALLLALVLAAAAAARRPRVDNPPFLSPKAGGMVVLDLSASIASDTYARIHESLQQLVARGGRYGLVVFSSVAYEALPPGTPASTLEPLTRYFALPTHVVPGEQPTYPVNPWSADFTRGTQISAGLDLARTIVLGTGVRHPAVVLISDLADDPNDIQRLTVVLNEYRAAGIRLRIIALNPASSDEAYFAHLIGSATAIIPAGLPGETSTPAASPHSSFPTWIVVLAIVVALLLGLNELRAARLRWGAPQGEVTAT